jgi:hypothetical protein
VILVGANREVSMIGSGCLQPSSVERLTVGRGQYPKNNWSDSLPSGHPQDKPSMNRPGFVGGSDARMAIGLASARTTSRARELFRCVRQWCAASVSPQIIQGQESA